MNKGRRILAIDIGNTNVHLGLVDMARLTCTGRIVFPTGSIKVRLVSAVNRLVGHDHELQIAVSSVVPGAVKTVLRLVSRNFSNPVEMVRVHKKIPFSIKYKNPKTLGTDRLANVLYAYYRFPKRNAVVVSAGTAITVDCLAASGAFIGGAILPGPSTQLESLNAKTAQLPRIAGHKNAARFPGTSTVQCMQAGVARACAGGIERCIQEVSRQYRQRPVVLISGGALCQVPAINVAAHRIRDLTLIGIALFMRTVKRQNPALL
jgi:type III pantothenate kinase